jgi:cobalt/nickel transport system permease protein
MLEETFADGKSFIHRLDPRVKTVVACAFSVITAVADKFPALLFATLLAVILTIMARLPVRAVARRLAVVNVFVVFLWLMLPFTYPGASVFDVGPLSVSREGIMYALFITIKSNAIILGCIALLSTTHLADLGRALSRLHIPDKIVHILLFMLRYLGLMVQEYQRLRTSMDVRCFRPRTNLYTYRSYANMVGMLLIGSYETAEAVYAAMLCRGFKGRLCALDEFEVRGADMLFSVVMAWALLLVALLQWTTLLT